MNINKSEFSSMLTKIFKQNSLSSYLSIEITDKLYALTERMLSENEKYIGLDPDNAFKCFDMDFVGMESIEKRNLRSVPNRKGNIEELITYEQTPCFAVNRYYADEKTLLPAPNIYVVSNGSGKVTCGEYEREIKKGDYFFAPYCIDGMLYAEGKGLELTQCCLPKID